MSALIVGGSTVPVATDGAQETAVFLGDRQRMQDGSMRTMVISALWKRQWAITTTLMTNSAAASLRAIVTGTTIPVTCSGDLLGGSVSCAPELTAYTPVNVRGVLYRRVAFTLYEV